MKTHGIQRKAPASIFAGELPGTPSRGDAARLRQRATEWLRARGQISRFHQTAVHSKPK